MYCQRRVTESIEGMRAKYTLGIIATLLVASAVMSLAVAGISNNPFFAGASCVLILLAFLIVVGLFLAQVLQWMHEDTDNQ